MSQKNSLTKADIDEILSASIVEDMKLEPKTTLVKVTLPNGFELIETSSCVDPLNYDYGLGKKICMKRIEDKIWYLEGYVLQSKIAGKL